MKKKSVLNLEANNLGDVITNFGGVKLLKGQLLALPCVSLTTQQFTTFLTNYSSWHSFAGQKSKEFLHLLQLTS